MQRYSSPLRSPTLSAPTNSNAMSIVLIVLFVIVLIVAIILGYKVYTQTCPKCPECISCTENRCLSLFGPQGSINQNLTLAAQPETEEEAPVSEGMCMSCSG